MLKRCARHPLGRRITATVFAVLLLAILGAGRTDGTAITDITIRQAVVDDFASFPDASIEALCFSPDSAVLACGTSTGRIVLLDVRQGSVLREIRGEGAAISSLSFSPDGTLLVSSDASGAVEVLDPRTGEPVWSFVDTAIVHEAGFSSSGSFLVAVGDSREVRIWDVETWKPRPSIGGHTGPIYAFAISPEEDLIVTGAGDDDPTIRLWTFPAGEPLGTDLYEGRVHDIEYSPSDRHVAISGTQPTIWLWEVDRIDILHLMFGGRTPVLDVAYSILGNSLVTVAKEGVFKYHRVPHANEQRSILFDEPLSAVDYSADRLFIACGDRAGNVFLLSVP